MNMNESAERRVITPAANVEGSVALPGDKSISHRYAMLAALADGRSRFENFSAAADCASTLACLRQAGVRIKHEGGRVEITGGPMAAPSEPLDCGNSGSTMRMLAGILAGQPFACEMTGDDSLRRRPMARIFEPLRQMGAAIEGAAGDRPPLRIDRAASAARHRL